VYALAFTKGHLTEARKALRRPIGSRPRVVNTFLIGLSLGISLTLFCSIIYWSTLYYSVFFHVLIPTCHSLASSPSSLYIHSSNLLLTLPSVITIGDEIRVTIRPVLVVYRILMLLCLLMWAWGMDLYVWSKYRVNYTFIFEFSPYAHFGYHTMFKVRLLALLSAPLLLWRPVSG
jgi:hypothetical protein